VINRDYSAGGSKLIEVTDLGATLRPANGTYTPAAGNDGLAGMADTDFIGSAAGETGIHAFDRTTAATIFADGGRATQAFQLGLVSYAEGRTNTFVILDPPAGLSASGMVAYKTGAGLDELTEQAAIYWPRIKVLNPDKTVYGNDDYVTVAPSGAMAGVYSRNDKSKAGGIYKQPAGIGTDDPSKPGRGVIQSCLGLETDEVLDINKRKVVFPKRINPISKEEGTRYFADGEWVLKAGGNFPTVAERRGINYHNRNILQILAPSRHDNNDEVLWDWAEKSAREYLVSQMRLGAMRYKDSARAFWVACNGAVNPPSSVFLYRYYLRYAVATAKPAIWGVVEVSQDLRDLERDLATA
jgi:hypothetical protein